MQSIRSRMIIWLLRNRHLLKFRLRAETVDETFSVMNFREQVDRFSQRMDRVPEDISVEAKDLAGIYGEIISPKKARGNRIIFYIHGGGFISGSCLTHRRHVIKLVQCSGIPALLFNYRLAPEHPYPAALDDCLTAYQWLLSSGYSAQDIVFAGESAGGTLVLSTLLKLRDSGSSLPRAGMAISPVTDMTGSGRSLVSNARKDIAPKGSWKTWTGLYAGDCVLTDRYLSPLKSELAGLPDLMIQVGSHEIHLDDAVQFARKAGAAGTRVELHVWKRMIHAFPMLSPLFPEARAALQEICDFISGKRSENLTVSFE